MLKGKVVSVNKAGGYFYIFIKSEDIKAFAHISQIENRELPQADDEVSVRELDFNPDKNRFEALGVKNLASHAPNNLFKNVKYVDFTQNKKEVKEVPQKEEVKAEVEVKQIEPKKVELNNDIKAGKHFLVVFNPLYNEADDMAKEKHRGETQAHCFYKLLKSNLLEGRENSYWGKLEAPNTEGPRINFDTYHQQFLVNEQNKQDTYLFISDFSYLWVCKIEAVDKTIEASELEKCLYFYQKVEKEKHFKVEVWFKVSDMKLLATSNKETYKYMANFDVPSQNIKSFNPYLCNIKYPLVLEDTSQENYFPRPDEKEVLKENELISSNTLSRELVHRIHSYLIPEEIFDLVPVAAQSEIKLAEALYIQLQKHKTEEKARKIQIFTHYAKALEAILRDLTLVKHKIDIGENMFSLGFFETEIKRYREGKSSILQNFTENLRSFFSTPDFHDFITCVKDLRNLSAHALADRLEEGSPELHYLSAVRKCMLGVGSKGLIIELYQMMDKKTKKLTATSLNDLYEEIDTEKYRNYKKVA